MKNILKKLGFLLLLIAMSCDLDGDLENPNQISVSGADVNLIMNAVQADFADFYRLAGATAGRLVRIESMIAGERYETAIRSTTTDALWDRAYQNVLNNAETVIELAEKANQTTHVGVAKILKAYTYLTLVDVYGDVPQSEALAGIDGNFNPVADDDAAVYAYALSLLNEARTELSKTGADAGNPTLGRDVYYGGSRARWITLANTLEFKAWLNISLISGRAAEANAKIATLLAANDLIDTEAENFTFKYAGVTVPPSRHPLYDQYYDPNKGSAGGYIGNYFMWELFQGNGVQDPRWRYYLYRQVGSNAQAFKIDPKNVGCGTKPEHYAASDVFCQFEPGFYGRDHGDDSGTNPDSPFITCAGVYPAGGKIDAKPTTDRTFHEPTIRGDGANGAGILPIFMSFFTDFMKAEHAIRNGNDVAGAKTLLATAVGNSIAQVKSFAASKGQTLPAGLEPSTSAYQSAVATKYDAAAVPMNVIGREFYMACFGNGVEAYNLYRRTGAPTNLQPARVPNPGVFFHSFIYPSQYVNLNNNATQKDPDATNPVFWDPQLNLK
jgi:hypothetical protein